MATYPNISAQTALAQAFTQLRKGTFPAKVDAGYLQRFSIAPGNESYVIAILRFLGLIDEDTNRINENTEFFYSGDEGFESGLENALRESYSQLFDEMGDRALDASREELLNWFRAADKTSELVGRRQAATFQTLAALAGHGQLPSGRSNSTKTRTTDPDTTTRQKTQKRPKAKKVDTGATLGNGAPMISNREAGNTQDVGLTVRIEVNLPPGGDADTYDAIFASIKKHLMS